MTADYYGNTAPGAFATIGGGWQNVAFGLSSTIAGASFDFMFVGIRRDHEPTAIVGGR